ncbi:MAG: AAA family ATPase [Candidatus Pacebacteria bacterium]|nr:AAA family ATPase [Candidatus Paceibacterota bacterium]
MSNSTTIPSSDSNPGVSELLAKLNPAQQEAVQHNQGPAIVLAGAGSGKTRVLTTRAAWLIKEHSVSPDQILLVTFTNKAAGEMNKRLKQLTGYQLPYSGTFHGLSARILRREAKKVGLSSNYLIYDTSDQLSLIKQIYKDLDLNPKKHKPNAVRAVISKAKNEMIDHQQYQRQAQDDFQQTVGRVYKIYQKRLREQDAVDFDDLLLKVVQLFQADQATLTKYQQQLRHVLVDEYQDTNKAQYQITKLLSQPQNNVYVVGDFAQSIYAWRGADYRNLFYLQQEFEQIREYRLERNYRSTEPILKAATKLIENNTTHPVLNLWTEKSSDKPITVIETSSSDQEAEAVVNQIHAQLGQGYRYQDLAILYRTNAQSRAFEEAFIKAGIPYRLIGGFKFYERAEIKDALAYLRLAANPKDSVSYERALKIGKRRYQRFEKWLNQQRQQGQTQAADQKTVRLDNPYEVLKGALKAANYLDKYDPKDPDDQQRLDNIQELLNVASQFEDITLFLENVSLVQDEQLKDLPLEEQENKITLMSLHSAKGLEFPVVFIVGMEEGLLPHSRSMFDPEQLEEERRLCYVGITRAKDKLYFIYTRERWMYGRSSRSTPSRFLTQIPNELTERKQYVGLGERNANLAANSGLKSKKLRIGIEVDEDELDALLEDELDVSEFLNS